MTTRELERDFLVNLVRLRKGRLYRLGVLQMAIVGRERKRWGVRFRSSGGG